MLIVHHTRKHGNGETPIRLRIDPALWLERASGHHAFISHLDGAFGLEREIESGSGDELIVFGGVARSSAAKTLLLDEDSESLLYHVADAVDALERLLTDREKSIWAGLTNAVEFSFGEACRLGATRNRKAVSSTLRKAENMGLLTRIAAGIYRKTQKPGSGGTGGTVQ